MMLSFGFSLKEQPDIIYTEDAGAYQPDIYVVYDIVATFHP
jgi:hypothetical protein